jgi:DNA-binding LacI/PurR family transcriptional regulator
MAAKQLKAVEPRPGQPLYVCARDSIRQAIDAGMFAPGEQMPSTKELSEQLEVSLVTAHRALQELVSTGVLQRSQGKGTFVHQRYLDRKDTLAGMRVGLFFHDDASLADFYHGQVLEGVRRASLDAGLDLILLRFGEDMRNECSGYLYFDPLPEDLQALGGLTGRRKQPMLAVGGKLHNGDRISSIEIDNLDLARQAVEHLQNLGHTSMGFVGGADHFSNAVDRWEGFSQTLMRSSFPPRDDHVIRCAGWKLDEQNRAVLGGMLSSTDRPSAIFAAGFFFALDVYSAAAQAGLRIPEDLSIVGVDDPPSAEYLSPPITTLRQPLIELGRQAFTTLAEQIQAKTNELITRTLQAQLMVRRSTARAPAMAATTAGAGR